MSDCTRVLREAGKPSPRTCKRCGLGPCRAPLALPIGDGAITQAEAEAPLSARARQLQRMLADDKAGAAFDMLYALRQQGIIRSLEASVMVDPVMVERHGADMRQRIRNELFNGIGFELEKAEAFAVTEQPGKGWTPTTFRASIDVVMP